MKDCYSTMQPTHFVYDYTASDIIMEKDHSDSERGNPLPPIHGLHVRLTARILFYMHHPTDREAYTTVFVMPVV